MTMFIPWALFEPNFRPQATVVHALLFAHAIGTFWRANGQGGVLGFVMDAHDLLERTETMEVMAC